MPDTTFLGGLERALGSDAARLWSRWIYVRVLGLLYVAAFRSLASQIVGLVGPNGIFPERQRKSVAYSRISHGVAPRTEHPT
jgi:hypothetical protein